MSKILRNIVRIDEELCTGCGQCILDCAEGAIALVDGKARVIADMYCDGLGACLSGCPTGALTIEQREAAPYDQEAVDEHLARQGRSHAQAHDHGRHEGHKHESRQDRHHGREQHESHHHGGHHHGEGHHEKGHGACGCAHSAPRPPAPAGCGCPGSRAGTLFAVSGGKTNASVTGPAAGLAAGPVAGMKAMPGSFTANTHWPLKIRLMSPDAPFLEGADLLIAADCAAFASPAFNDALRPGRITLIGCPKFEDYRELSGRLAEIFRTARPKSCTVARMEVPCCNGLLNACREAGEESGVPVREVVVARTGDLKGGWPASGE